MSNVVWGSTVDNGTFNVQVLGEEGNSYRGRLVVTVVESGEVLLDEPVGISYGAPFGADVADVADWQEKALKPIDEYLARQGP